MATVTVPSPDRGARGRRSAPAAGRRGPSPVSWPGLLASWAGLPVSWSGLL